MMETKAAIRKRILEQRSLLSLQEVSEKSREITGRLCSLSQYAGAGTVMAYMSFRNEVETSAFINRCIRDGKRVVLPKVQREPGMALLPYEIKDLRQDVLPGLWGIPEPDASRMNMADPLEIDIVVVPGVAFDGRRYRIGYGAGYYDRFLLSLRPDCLKVGIAFDMQILDKCYAEKHDIPMDLVITELRIL